MGALTDFFAACFVVSLLGSVACDGGDGEMPETEEPMPVDPGAMDPAPNPQTPTPPPPATKEFGEACQASSECASGLCLVDPSGAGRCSEFCTVEVANDCQAVGGFCVPLESGEHGCWGELDTGYDQDDDILRIGDAATRSLTPLDDADLFLVHVVDGMTYVLATPEGGLDLQVEAYNTIAEPFFVGDLMAGGGEEGVAVTASEDGYVFIVIRNVGTTTGPYTVRVSD